MEAVKKNIKSTFDELKNGEPEAKNLNVPYSDEELSYRGYVIKRLEDARDQREQSYQEFDDMSYSQWYDDNARAANSYNAPKANKEDVRIVTGTTLEKENTLLSALLNYNLEPTISAYNKDDIKITEIGKIMEDFVAKSRGIEHYDEKRPLIYKELLDQGTCFVEEVKVEKIKVCKKLKNIDWNDGGVKMSSIKWERKLKKLYAQCKASLLEGKKVYLGNMREFFLDEQPYAFIYDTIPYDQAKYLYGDWERWKNVPRKVVKIDTESYEEDAYRDWSLMEIDQEFVEVIKYQDPHNNELQIFLNGVMMLPVGFPLTAVSPSGGFTFSKGDIQPISKFFAYSKSIPAKTKVDQAVLDEMLKMILLKIKQSFMPPMANRTNKVLSRKIFYPGAITPGLNADDLQEIGQNNGVTQSEFNVFQLMKDLINEKTVSPTFGGDATSGSTTATEINQMQKQQMMKLGGSILGALSLERQMTNLRIYNILDTWTQPIDQRVNKLRGTLEDVYRTITVDTIFEDGKSGERIVDFDPRKASLFDTYDIDNQEKMVYEKSGRKVKINYIDPKALKMIDLNWEIIINPTERDSSQLDRVLFVQNIMEAMQLFGPQALNMEHIKERFAMLVSEDPDKFFLQQQQQPAMGQPQEGGTEMGANIEAQLKSGVGSEINPPSLNTLQTQ